MIRVFAVDDSPFVRKALRKVLAATTDLTLVGEAATADEALARIPQTRPQVVTLDVRLHGRDGLSLLRELLALEPGLRVVMLSAHTQEGAEATVEALAAGAVDCVDKQALNFMDLEGLGRGLVDRLRLLGSAAPRGEAPQVVPAGPVVRELGRMDLCVIGASTGGPAALQAILEALPADLPVPVAIVQHMPVGFTRPFANRLNGLCRLRVSEAEEGKRLERGQVIIAPAGTHLELTARMQVRLRPEDNGARHVPSVDLLFQSAARVLPGRVAGVLLTGMGEDGATGLALIRAGGGVTIAESEATCAVYGMPRAAVTRGAVQHLLPLPQIVAALAAWGRERG